MGLQSNSIQYDIADTIRRCDPSIRRELWTNVVLSGGNTCFPGMVERLQGELDALAPAEANVCHALQCFNCYSLICNFFAFVR